MSSLLEENVKRETITKEEFLQSLNLNTTNDIDPKVLSDTLNLSVDDIIDSSKYPYIGGGTCRTVLDLGNGYVVKLTDEGMIKDNLVEWDVWNKSPKHLKKFLTPCFLDSENPQKIYMIKAEPVSFNNFQSFFIKAVGVDKTIEIMNVIHELESTFNLLYVDLISPYNWGKIGEEYKLIDYGLIYGNHNSNNN